MGSENLFNPAFKGFCVQQFIWMFLCFLRAAQWCDAIEWILWCNTLKRRSSLDIICHTGNYMHGRVRYPLLEGVPDQVRILLGKHHLNLTRPWPWTLTMMTKFSSTLHHFDHYSILLFVLMIGSKWTSFLHPHKIIFPRFVFPQKNLQAFHLASTT